MKMKVAGISGIVAAMLAVVSVQAVPINGSIYMGGEATLNKSDTAVTGWPFVYVVAGSGAFSSIPSFTVVNMSSSQWVFSPQPGQPLNNLWTVGSFSFNFEGDTVSKNGNFMTVDGFGTISSTNPNYSTTDFNWNLTAENLGGTVDFIFTASTGAGGGGGGTVPDGGLTLVLLGIALAGIEVFRRRLSNA
jgi:VPDSG-CTERM motif